MIGKVAQAIVGAHKVYQAGKTAKSGVQRIQRNVDRSGKTKPKSSGPLFKNIRTPSNSGGMQKWNNPNQPKKVVKPNAPKTAPKPKAAPKAAPKTPKKK